MYRSVTMGKCCILEGRHPSFGSSDSFTKQLVYGDQLGRRLPMTAFKELLLNETRGICSILSNSLIVGLNVLTHIIIFEIVRVKVTLVLFFMFSVPVFASLIFSWRLIGCRSGSYMIVFTIINFQ